MKLWPAALLLTTLGLAQTSFRTDVHLINVGFSVRDPQGKFLTSLTQDDFEILEDGVPQKIAFFAKSADVPLTLGLVGDMSGSQGKFLKEHEKDLRNFLRAALAPKDQAFLLAFRNQLRLVTDFSTPDRDLAKALEGYRHLKDTSAYPELGPVEIRTGGTALFDAIYYSSVQMLARTESSRRALIVFSDGEDNSSAHHELEAIEAAQSNNATLFCVRYTESEGRLNSRNKYGASIMARMALETGGTDYDAQAKGLDEHFKAIGEQLHSSYELGYHSTDTKVDDTFHKITIRAKDPNLTVRAKTGYYARR
jgi:Ca-activated chloride channel homolog